MPWRCSFARTQRPQRHPQQAEESREGCRLWQESVDSLTLLAQAAGRERNSTKSRGGGLARPSPPSSPASSGGAEGSLAVAARPPDPARNRSDRPDLGALGSRRPRSFAATRPESVASVSGNPCAGRGARRRTPGDFPVLRRGRPSSEWAKLQRRPTAPPGCSPLFSLYRLVMPAASSGRSPRGGADSGCTAAPRPRPGGPLSAFQR